MAHKRRRLAPEIRKEQILNAAYLLFLERGFDRVTMADIAEQVDMSRPNIYGYFPSTLAILDALLLAHEDRLERQIRLFALTETHSTQERLSALEGIIDLLIDEGQALHLMHSGNSPELRERRMAFNERIERAMLTPEYQQQLERYPGLLEVLRIFMTSVICDRTLENRLPRPELARVLSTFIVAGVSGVKSRFALSDSPLTQVAPSTLGQSLVMASHEKRQ